MDASCERRDVSLSTDSLAFVRLPWTVRIHVAMEGVGSTYGRNLVRVDWAL